MNARLSGFLELTKPRILTLVLITTALGYFLGLGAFAGLGRFCILLAGVAMVCGGSAVLNHYLERDADAKMERTKDRPLPTGLIIPQEALSFGIILCLGGVFLLWWKINLLTAFLGLLTAFLYVLVYTPMKKLSWLNTTIGSIPGALPPVGGWTAATGEISLGAGVLFLILFAWQHPHFYSIAWMCREDYARGGFQMLPNIPNGPRRTIRQIIGYSFFLIGCSLLPAVIGLSGQVYAAGALILGIYLLEKGYVFAKHRSVLEARNLLRASVIYLPALFLLILFDFSFLK